jgi:anti-anti-sigma factor
MAAAKQLETRVRPAPGAAIIDLGGDITAGAEAALQAVYGQAAREGGPAIILNFAGVDYINSSGIALIVTLLSRARSEGRRLLASGLSEHYVEIFQITRLADFLTICADEASALAALGEIS